MISVHTDCENDLERHIMHVTPVVGRSLNKHVFSLQKDDKHCFQGPQNAIVM